MVGIGNASSYDVEPTTSSSEASYPEHCISAGSPSQVTITIYVITLVASLIGNSLLIIAFVRMKEKVMLLIANMAVSDLLVAIFLLPRFITKEAIGSNAFLIHGSGGTFLCKMCSFLSDISLSVSTLSLVLIAVERFLAVVHPLLYKKTSCRRRRLLVASTWIMAAAFHSPYFYTFRLVRFNNNGHDVQFCLPNWEPAFDNKSAHRRYNVFLFTTVLILPLLVISVLYIVVAFHLRRDKMRSFRSDNGTRRNRKRIRNLVRMATATVTALLICWTLHIVISFIYFFSPWVVPKCSKSFMVVSYISGILASCYCAVNPWICFIFIRRFSRELRVVMHKRKFRHSGTKGRKIRRFRESNTSNVQLHLESFSQ